MPVPDPIPSPPSPGQRHAMMRRFWRILRLLALLSIAIAALAVARVARGDPVTHVHMMIATALGVGLTVLIGSGLMTLTFLSHSSGHDDQAAGRTEHKDDLR